MRTAVYAATDNNYRNMFIAAKSLLKTTRMDRVYFLTEGWIEGLPDVITVVPIVRQGWFTPDGPNYHSQWTYMSMIRLALPEILKEDRVLWLDTDTVVEQDIGDLFDIDLAGNYVAMVEEPVRSKFPFQYFNAGVMLMDLNRIRMDGTHHKWIRLINTQPYTAPDQDVINLICQGEILALAPEYNDASFITQRTQDPYIRHYAGVLKRVEPPVFRQLEQEEWKVKTR